MCKHEPKECTEALEASSCPQFVTSQQGSSQWAPTPRLVGFETPAGPAEVAVEVETWIDKSMTCGEGGRGGGLNISNESSLSPRPPVSQIQ